MLRLLSSKAQESKKVGKPSKPCYVGIYWIALAENSLMSTRVPGFQSFSAFASFCIGQISHHRQKGSKAFATILDEEKNGYVARDQLLYAL